MARVIPGSSGGGRGSGGKAWSAAKSSGTNIPVSGSSGSGVAKTGSSIRKQNTASKSYVSKSPQSAKQKAAAAKNSDRMKKTYKKAANSNRKATAAASAGFVSGAAVVGVASKDKKKSKTNSAGVTRRGLNARTGKNMK